MLACRKSAEEVYAFTDVSPRQQRRIMKLWRETADVKSAREGPEMRGRPRTLSSDDVAVGIHNTMPMNLTNACWHSFCKAQSTGLVTRTWMNYKSPLARFAVLRLRRRLFGVP